MLVAYHNAMASPAGSPLLRPRWPLLVLLLGACLPLARALVDPLGSLPGSPLSDLYKHSWSYWHTLQQIGDGSWPFTTHLKAPAGGLIMDVMTVPNLLLAPVTLTAGPVLACNLWVLLMVTAVGLGTYCLARHLTSSLPGSLCAGLLAQTSPFLLGHALTSGVHERLLVWVFPLMVLGLLLVRERGGLRWPAALTAAALVTALSCPTYGLFLGLLMVLALVVWRLWLCDGREARVRSLALTYAGVALALGACAALYHWLVKHPDWLASIPQQRVAPTIGITSPQFDVARLCALFNPLAVRHEQPTRTDDELYLLVYIGWVPLLAMIGGAVVAARRKRKTLMAVLGLALLFLLLSLGPWVDIGVLQIFNPVYYVLSWAVPFYGGAQPVWQQAGVFVGLGLVGVAALVGAAPLAWQRWGLAAVILAGALTERALALPVPLVVQRADASVPAIYDRTRGTGGLVDIPRFRPGHKLTPGMMFTAQTRHGHPMPVGININRGFFDGYSPLVSMQVRSWREVAHCLRRRGYRWVVVHRKLFSDRQRGQPCLRGFEQAVGKVADDGSRVLFDLSKLRPGDVEESERCPGKER